jgi:xanthine/CO dehydrogenase XdhC/CoxF family maturation factor
MNQTRSICVAIAAISLALPLVGCARPATIVIAEPIGPAPSTSVLDARQGSLIVFTESDASPSPSQSLQEHGKGRLGFAVIDPKTGAVLVEVAAGEAEPPTVKLTAGQYRVRAESLSRALIEATVRIEAGKTTELYLDGNHAFDEPKLRANAQFAPDGAFIGWRASSS